MKRFKFVGTDLTVFFYVEKMHACCGAAIISGASFHFNTGRDELKKTITDTDKGIIPEYRKKFYKEWWANLSISDNSETQRNLLIFVDPKWGEYQGKYPCLYEFGEVIGAMKSGPIYNQRSARNLYTFSAQRKIYQDHTITLLETN